ncbi:transcriptional adapter 3 [Caerostris extrusa]|uniref:Transcriptional adapter 3 n=1 Tax=Caerostris extrusa TaxID=172846 RepID=A0AAV4VDY3_CAEEX|nr:transcriptional adapter 3 [Caerostris extrusa]
MSTDSVEKKSSDERPPKKGKESSSKASASNHHKFIMPPLLDPHQEIPKPPKNDAPSRFWSHIEPFAADITQDIIKTVERWINPEETYENLQNIPEKGEHYSKVWPIEDLTEEIIEGSKSVENAKGLFSNSAQDTAEIERILKLGERKRTSTTVDDSECTLLDKLVYSLVGEKFMIQIDDTMNEFYNDDLLQEEKHCTVDSADESIEKRLYKDFIEAGVLESDTEESEDEKDEVYEELQELQRAFIPLNKYNIIKKKSLLAMAKARMGQQEIKKKLLEHDAKIMELYRMVSNARKNKTMNKKLEDQVKRTQRERKKLIRKLMEKS